jgi:hypothetical protein
MSGKSVALAVAAVGWLLASLLAFVIVTLVGFFGIGLIGLLIWFICTRVELEADGGESLFGAQHQTRQDMTSAERASYRHEQSLAHQSTRFFKNLGIGLTVIGFAGFLYGLGVFAA